MLLFMIGCVAHMDYYYPLYSIVRFLEYMMAKLF